MLQVPAAHVAWHGRLLVPVVQQLLQHRVPSGWRRHAPPPSQKPSRPQVDGASAPHSLSGSVPPAIGAQAPSLWPVLAAEHPWHVPPQEFSQQNPSTQDPDWQSAPPPPGSQAWPLAFLGGPHCFVTESQARPPVQSELLAHAVLQVALLSQIRLPGHGPDGKGTQVPAPSQRGAGVDVLPLHEDAPHAVVEEYSAHALAPSHVPFRRQLMAPSFGHSPSGSVPGLTGRHRPSAWLVLTCAQARHNVAQRSSQHTPSVQNPDAQAPSLPHRAPFPSPASEATSGPTSARVSGAGPSGRAGSPAASDIRGGSLVPLSRRPDG